MSSDVAIAVRGLTKEYVIAHEEKYTTLGEKMLATLKNPLRQPKTERFRALSDVSFDVKAGEVVGIIGRNGAGKSTLLKVLSRITEPTSGEVKLYGRVASLLEVGTGFHPELTGRENIFLNGAILGMTRAEIRKHFDAIVDFAEIEKFLDTPVKRYSSGMYVRLAFAVAAHLNPEILVVDEVLSVGDVEFQKKCLGKMREVSQSSGRTVLFVSHNMVAVRSLCTTGCVLSDGRVALRASCEECVKLYMSHNQGASDASVALSRPEGAPQWMTRARILVNGEPSSSLYMGDELTIEVDFAAEVPIQKPRLGLTVYAADGTCLINTDNRFQQGASYNKAVHAGRMICRFGKVPLVADRYAVTLWFGDVARDSHIADKVITFNVIEKDIWGTGRCPSSRDSYLWWPTQIELDAAGESAAADDATSGISVS